MKKNREIIDEIQRVWKISRTLGEVASMVAIVYLLLVKGPLLIIKLNSL